MASASVCVSTPELGHENGCSQCFSPSGGSPSLGRSHLPTRWAQNLSSESLCTEGLCTFLSGDFQLLSEINEFVHGHFEKMLFLPLMSSRFSKIFLAVVNSQENQILWHLFQLCWVQKLLIVIMLPRSDPPLVQGRLHTLRLLLASCEVPQLEGGFFPPERNFCLFPSVGTTPCCGGSFYPVFSSLSGVVIPSAVVNLLCLWMEVSSESSYAAILTLSVNLY